jgi:drug/metabolite transporter (DMT)-like permease
MAFAAGVSLPGLLTVRFLGSAVLLWTYLALTRHRNPLPGRRDAVRLLGLGVGFAAQAALFFSGIHRLPASVAILLNYLYPVHVAIMAWAITRRAPDRREWGAMILALTGVALTAGANAFGRTGSLDPIGVVLALGSSLGYASFITASSVWAGEVNPVTSTAFITTSAGLTYLIAGGFSRTLTLETSSHVLGMMAGIIVLGTTLPLATLIAGIAIVGPTSASLLNTVEPVSTALLAALFLGERLTSTQGLGGVLILTAVILVNLPGQVVDRPMSTGG